jgi:hypothetical protein
MVMSAMADDAPYVTAKAAAAISGSANLRIRFTPCDGLIEITPPNGS